MDRVLIVDDDRELCELVEEYLCREGFTVDVAHDGETGLDLARQPWVNIVVLDVMLPGVNGFDILRELRAQGQKPVLMLTARGDDVDRIVGLEMGADDYLPKPFNPRELVARIRAVLRRASVSRNGSAKLHIGDVELDPGTRTASRGSRRLSLTTVEFEILRTLLENAGRVVTRDSLSEKVLGRPFSPLDRSVDTHVSNLRKKLHRTTTDPELIKTVRGEGYQFVIAPS